jgi:hypothetical protein
VNLRRCGWVASFFAFWGRQLTPDNPLGLFGGEHSEVRDSAHRPVFWLNGRERNYYSIPVPDGEAGKLWSIHYGRGAICLLTVPLFFARSAAELLLPAEVGKTALFR